VATVSTGIGMEDGGLVEPFEDTDGDRAEARYVAPEF
jgi:hypothetical protein